MVERSATPLSILIVDARADNRDSLRKRLMTLEGWRLNIEGAADGPAALEALKASPRDLVFLEYRLPGQDGLELLIRLRQAHPKSAVVMVTAQGGEKVAAEAIKSGALDYLSWGDLPKMDLGPILKRVLEIRYMVDQNMELRQVNQMKNEFIANVSHELRTPLSVIIGYAQTLLNASLGPINPAQNKALDAIHVRAEELLATLNQMLRMGDEKDEPVLEPVELRGLLSRHAARPSRERGRKKIALQLELPDREIWVSADEEKLSVVVDSLLSNAFKFSPQDGTVLVTLGLSDGTATVAVKDLGPGVAQEMLPKLFEQFSAASLGPTREHAGLGLGLPISKRIIDRHGGQIWIESKQRGAGTTACFSLPLLAKPGPALAAGGKKRILVVEDNPDILDVLLLFMSSLGRELELVTARSGFEALQKVEEARPDLIVLDLMMPGMDGFEVIARLRKTPATAEIPVMVLTGYAEAAQRAQDSGAQEVLLKPFEKQVFVQKLARLLDPKETK